MHRSLPKDSVFLASPVVPNALSCMKKASAPSVAAQKPSPPEGKSDYAKLDGNRIHYQSYGKGRIFHSQIHMDILAMLLSSPTSPSLPKRKKPKTARSNF